MFHDEADYRRFLQLLAEGRSKHPVDVLSYCEMPNHFHLLVRPETDNALSAYMERVTGRYASYFRRKTKTLGQGHVFGGRFWNKPIEGSVQFLGTLRYIEANALSAGLVSHAEDWPWSSLFARLKGESHLLSALPVTLPSLWTAFVNLPQSETVLKHIDDLM